MYIFTYVVPFTNMTLRKVKRNLVSHAKYVVDNRYELWIPFFIYLRERSSKFEDMNPYFLKFGFCKRIFRVVILHFHLKYDLLARIGRNSNSATYGLLQYSSGMLRLPGEIKQPSPLRKLRKTI